MYNYNVFSDNITKTLDAAGNENIRLQIMLESMHQDITSEVKQTLLKYDWTFFQALKQTTKPDKKIKILVSQISKELFCTLRISDITNTNAPTYSYEQYKHRMMPWIVTFHATKHKLKKEFNFSKTFITFEYVGDIVAIEPSVVEFLQSTHHCWNAITVQKIAGLAFQAIQQQSPGRSYIKSFRKLVSMPIGLESKQIMRIVNGYAVTPKADGERVLVIISHDSNIFYRLHNGMVCEPIGCKYNLLDEIFWKHNFVLDCEWIASLKKAFVFDQTCWKSISMATQCFTDRWQIMIDQWIPERPLLCLKDHAVCGDIWTRCKQIIDRSYPFRVDGLIFTPMGEPYINRSIFKWKPVEEITVDGIITWDVPKKCKQSPDLYRPPKHTTLPFILSGNTKTKYRVPQSFCLKRLNRLKPIVWYVDRRPMTIQYDGAIPRFTVVECRYDKNHQWSIVRVREDKTRVLRAGLMQNIYVQAANHLWTANSCWRAICRPITRAMLTSGKLPKHYYLRTNTNKCNHRPNIYKYHNHVKRWLIDRFIKPGSNILELAGGRGGDLMKLIKRRPRFVRFIDIDEAALKEAKRRLASINPSYNRRFEFCRQDLTLLSTPEWFIPASGLFTIVETHFAIHYLFGSKACLDNIIRRVETVTNIGAIWLITTLDGEACSAAFNKTPTVDLGPFVLERLYKDNPSPFGSAVRFSSQTITPRIEFLVQHKILQQAMNNWTLVESYNFKDISVPSRPTFKDLSHQEQRYSTLNRTYVFKRKY